MSSPVGDELHESAQTDPPVGDELHESAETDLPVADELHESAETAVFWDMEDCQIPDDLNIVEVSLNIRKALKNLKYKAKATIYAYGDTDQIKAGLKSTGYVVKQHADAGKDVDLSKREIDYRGTGAIFSDQTNEELNIVVNHTPAGERKARHFKILTDFLTWAVDFEPFVTLIIIVGRSITPLFKRGVFELFMTGYNIILVQPRNLPGNASASDMEPKLLWEDLSAGQYSSSLRKRKDPPTPTEDDDTCVVSPNPQDTLMFDN
ncbi:unnamed protein product [Arabidopsis halleri]